MKLGIMNIPPMLLLFEFSASSFEEVTAILAPAELSERAGRVSVLTNESLCISRRMTLSRQRSTAVLVLGGTRCSMISDGSYPTTREPLIALLSSPPGRT
jgi:hypothetical protein